MTRRFTLPLGAVAAAALAIRIAYVVGVLSGDEPVGDAKTYVALGRGLANGDGYVRPVELVTTGVHHPTAEFPPLWPLVLSVPERLGLTSPTGLRVVGAMVGAATVVVIGLLGRRLATPTVGLVAASMAAIDPFLISFDGSLQAEGLYALGAAAVLLLLANALHDPPDNLRWWALGGVALGLTVLTRTEALLLVPIVVVPIARAGVDTRLWWTRVGVVCAGVAVLLGAWTVRNAVRLHTFQPLTNNSGTLVAGSNCDRVYSGYQLGLWRLDCATDIDVTGLSETETAARFRQVGFDYARDHTGRVPTVLAARVMREWGVWDPTAQANFESLEGRPKGWIQASWLGTWMVIGLAAVGVAVQRRARRPLWLLLGPVVVAVMSAGIAYGISRFRMVAEPGLLVLAAVGAVALVQAVAPRRRIAAT